MQKALRHHTQADGTIVCRHRDLSCCADCAKHPFVVEVAGAHFYVPNLIERTELLKLIDAQAIPATTPDKEPVMTLTEMAAAMTANEPVTTVVPVKAQKRAARIEKKVVKTVSATEAKRNKLVAAERKRIEREDAAKLKALRSGKRNPSAQLAAAIAKGQKAVEGAMLSVLQTGSVGPAQADVDAAIVTLKAELESPEMAAAVLGTAADAILAAKPAKSTKGAQANAQAKLAAKAASTVAPAAKPVKLVHLEGLVVVHVPTGRNHTATAAGEGLFTLTCWTAKPVKAELVSTSDLTLVECPRCAAKLAVRS
jgi:hypothetical protein